MSSFFRLLGACVSFLVFLVLQNFGPCHHPLSRVLSPARSYWSALSLSTTQTPSQQKASTTLFRLTFSPKLKDSLFLRSLRQDSSFQAERALVSLLLVSRMAPGLRRPPSEPV